MFTWPLHLPPLFTSSSLTQVPMNRSIILLVSLFLCVNACAYVCAPVVLLVHASTPFCSKPHLPQDGNTRDCESHVYPCGQTPINHRLLMHHKRVGYTEVRDTPINTLLIKRAPSKITTLLPFITLPNHPLPPLGCKIKHNHDKQRHTENAGPPAIVVCDGLARADRLAAVQVDADRVT